MKRTYKIIRAILVVLLVLILLIPAALYVVMATPPFQEKVREIGQEELTKLLGSDVTIGSVTFTPYNKVALRDVLIKDDKGDTAAYIKRLGAGIDLHALLIDERISVNYAELIGLDARLYKETPQSQLNIQSIIDALSPKDKNKPPTKFDLKVNNIVIRNSRVKYDVLSEAIDSLKLDVNHILISDFNADVRLPRIKNDDFTAEVKRFTLREKSGLTLSNLSGDFHITNNGSTLQSLSIQFPESHITFADIELNYDGWNNLLQGLKQHSVTLKTLNNSHVSLSDFRGLSPALENFDATLSLEIDITGTLDTLSINELAISSQEENISLTVNGTLNNIMNVDSIRADIKELSLKGYGSDIADILLLNRKISPKGASVLSKLGQISFDGKIKGTPHLADVDGYLNTSNGNVALHTKIVRPLRSKAITFTGKIDGNDVNIGNIISNNDLGKISATVNHNITLLPNAIKGNISSEVTQAEYKGYCYSGLNTLINLDDNKIDGSLNIADNNINLTLAGEAILNEGIPEIDIHLDANDIAFDRLNLSNKYPGYKLSASIDAIYTGKTFDDASALLTINGLKYINDDNIGLNVENINIEMDNTMEPHHININSDFVDGLIEGQYDPSTILPAVIDILAQSFPVMNKSVTNDSTPTNHNYLAHKNDFKFNFTIKDNNQLTDFIKSPVRLIHPIEISGELNHQQHKMSLLIDIPYLDQNYKLIKNSSIHLDIDDTIDKCQFYATTLFPTKNGDAEIAIACYGNDNRLDTDISWHILRERTFRGNINLSTLFGKRVNSDETETLLANVSINPSQMIFNDTIWSVNPASILIEGNDVTIDGFDVRRDNQYITLNGKISPNPDDEMRLNLLNVNLDYIFETLAINNVMFGGNATGTFIAKDIFSKEPQLSTPGLSVKGLSYNHAVLGDAIIESQWVQANKAVTIDATVAQDNGRTSYINGEIFPMNDSLDFKFKADKINVGFMEPFMSAFAKDVSGFASGDARLWGTFKFIDMVGDIYAEDLRLKIDFTNTYYTATDSVHLKPGYIEFDNIDLYDAYGNNAKLGGYLKHYCFKRPEYNFQITNAKNFLCYDETEKRSPIWWGRIFGNGKATVEGVPGTVKITVNMSTAPKSNFTFVLSDAEVANEYNFITFRDRNKVNGTYIEPAIDPKLEKVKRLEAIIEERKRQDNTPTIYNMEIIVDANPDVDMTLVMDPIGGDCIKAHGNGNIRMTYNSQNEDLTLHGKYTLQDGKYNFTLQDIIIKDFIINSGSSIKFEKNPYEGILDLVAIYPLNANLSDLDESFLQDTDLNRTNVPVHAEMTIKGSMSSPDVKFDLKFPTLSQDVYRKVKSIVSTDDMMNRQIIYLLALNRFYTPEYMASTTKGNELVSVASSTISSHLTSMLSELSDNWNFSPNFRSDKGDFSDVEVDLALSSRLLNNRLLFNGNFGYRDKSMNNNSFIGDFDLEYLLNRSGNVRLKAYNRYNDQNYYLKTALTTQGVGVVFKRDFDNMFSFLRPAAKSESDSTAILNDSIVVKPDTIAIADSIQQPLKINTDSIK